MKDKSVFAKRWFVIAALLVISFCAVGAAFFVDAPIEHWVQRHQTPSGLTFMKWVSRVGEWYGHVAVALIGLAIAYFRGSKNWMRICLALIVACAIGGSVARVGKMSLGRARPTTVAMKHWSGFNVHSKNHSFPSGHTTTTFAFFGVLLFVRRKLGALLLPIPALIGFSRIYLLAHYFSDVVAGVICGLFSAWLTVRWMRLQIDRRKSTAET